MKIPITASMLYDLVACPHKVTMDNFGDLSKKDENNVFIQLLWERGTLFEREVISKLEIPFVDLSMYLGDEKERKTKEAMDEKTQLIYGGRVSANDLLGDPDLLRLEGNAYVPGDIKSGSGEEGDEDNGKPKIHYAVQLGLYVDILERKGLSAGRRGYIWDIHGEEVVYDLEVFQGKRSPQTLWTKYEECLVEARKIVSTKGGTIAAYGAPCKHCHWLTACLADLHKSDDLTLLSELGRTKKDVLVSQNPTVVDFANADLSIFIKRKKSIFPGIGKETLEKLHRRPKLVKSENPTSQTFDSTTSGTRLRPG